MKLLQKKKRLVYYMCAGSVPHNQTCVMLNMSAKPCGNDYWAAGLVQVELTRPLVGCNLNRHACCSSATVPSIPVSHVQLQHTLLVVRCNLHRRLLSLCLVNRQVCWGIIAKLEWILSNVQQNIEQLQTPTMGVTINKKSTTTTEPPP